MPTTSYIALDFDGVLHHCGIGPAKKEFDLYNARGRHAFLNALHDQDHPLVGESFYLDPEGLNCPEGRLFDRERFLVDLLQSLPEARIVLATSWCEGIAEDGLREMLSMQVRDRVVGALMPHANERGIAGTRGHGMEAWLSRRNEPSAKWIAIDDQERHYASHASHVVTSPVRGMNDEVVGRAITKLR